jgi:hypothetical protein
MMIDAPPPLLPPQQQQQQQQPSPSDVPALASEQTRERMLLAVIKAKDGQPVDEVGIYLDHRIIVTFVKEDMCSHVVVTNDVVYGGTDTVLAYLYKRMLFGAYNKSPASPVSASLACMIASMYDSQFKSADRKKKKLYKRFSTSECFGHAIDKADAFRKQLAKELRNRWHYHPASPAERERRRSIRAAAAATASSTAKAPSSTGKKRHKKKNKSDKA